MEKLKRITGIFILFFCGIIAIVVVTLIRILIEQPKDLFTLFGFGVISVSTIIIFFLAKLGLRLIHSSTSTDLINQIGK